MFQYENLVITKTIIDLTHLWHNTLQNACAFILISPPGPSFVSKAQHHSGSGQYPRIRMWAPYPCRMLQQGKGRWKSKEDIICSKTWTKNIFISNTASLQGKMLNQDCKQGRVEWTGPGSQRWIWVSGQPLATSQPLDWANSSTLDSQGTFSANVSTLFPVLLPVLLLEGRAKMKRVPEIISWVLSKWQ